MLKDENGNRVKLNSDLFYKLMKDDKRKIKDLMACIANECHVSIDAVVQWKKGKNSPGDLEFVKIIAKILVVDYKMLICEVDQNDIKENEIRKIVEFQDYIRENTIQENINAIEYKNKEKEYEKHKTEQEIENVKEEMVDISKPIIEKFSWCTIVKRVDTIFREKYLRTVA